METAAGVQPQSSSDSLTPTLSLCVEIRSALWARLAVRVVGWLLYLAARLRLISVDRAFEWFVAMAQAIVIRSARWRMAGGRWQRFDPKVLLHSGEGR